VGIFELQTMQWTIADLFPNEWRLSEAGRRAWVSCLPDWMADEGASPSDFAFASLSELTIHAATTANTAKRANWSGVHAEGGRGRLHPRCARGANLQSTPCEEIALPDYLCCESFWRS
jgi:hypothetical protein